MPTNEFQNKVIVFTSIPSIEIFVRFMLASCLFQTCQNKNIAALVIKCNANFIKFCWCSLFIWKCNIFTFIIGTCVRCFGQICSSMRTIYCCRAFVNDKGEKREKAAYNKYSNKKKNYSSLANKYGNSQ